MVTTRGTARALSENESERMLQDQLLHNAERAFRPRRVARPPTSKPAADQGLLRDEWDPVDENPTSATNADEMVTPPAVALQHSCAEGYTTLVRNVTRMIEAMEVDSGMDSDFGDSDDLQQHGNRTMIPDLDRSAGDSLPGNGHAIEFNRKDQIYEWQDHNTKGPTYILVKAVRQTASNKFYVKKAFDCSEFQRNDFHTEYGYAPPSWASFKKRWETLCDAALRPGVHPNLGWALDGVRETIKVHGGAKAAKLEEMEKIQHRY